MREIGFLVRAAVLAKAQRTRRETRLPLKCLDTSRTQAHNCLFAAGMDLKNAGERLCHSSIAITMDNENENRNDGRQSLYSDTLLSHFRNPRNYGSLPSPDIAYEEFNPLCGDRIRIELKISDNRIAAAHFVGDGCAISIAAASLLTELLLGAEIDKGAPISEEELLSSLKSDIKPSRMKCALLPFEALRSCLKIFKQERPSR